MTQVAADCAAFEYALHHSIRTSVPKSWPQTSMELENSATIKLRHTNSILFGGLKSTRNSSFYLLSNAANELDLCKDDSRIG